MKYYKAEDVIRKRAEDLADTSYWEYGNPKNVDDWIEVAEMEFKDLPTIEVEENCISKAYLEQEIENLCRTVDKDKEYWRGWNDALDKVVELIEDAPSVVPSRVEGGWVPCSERLPDDDELMLVNYVDPRPEAMDIWIGWHEMENVWYIDGEAHSNELGNEVIAWMPLPEPWKGADDERVHG